MRLLPRLFATLVVAFALRARALSRPPPPMKTSTAGSGISGRPRKRRASRVPSMTRRSAASRPIRRCWRRRATSRSSRRRSGTTCRSASPTSGSRAAATCSSRHRALLDEIEGRYGVDRHILVAIWGMESFYGEVLSDPKIVKSVDPLAGDARLCRPAAREVRPPAADRGAEDPAARRHLDRRHDRLVGGRHGPHSVHPDHLRGLCRRFRRRRAARPLEFAGRRARLGRQLSEQGRLGFRHDLGLRGRCFRRTSTTRLAEDGKPRSIGEWKKLGARARARRGLSAAGRQGRADRAGRRRAARPSCCFATTSSSSATTTRPPIRSPSGTWPIACAAAATSRGRGRRTSGR